MANDGRKTFYTIGWSNEHIAELLTEVNERLIDLELSKVALPEHGPGYWEGMAQRKMARQRIKDKYKSKERV